MHGQRGPQSLIDSCWYRWCYRSLALFARVKDNVVDSNEREMVDERDNGDKVEVGELRLITSHSLSLTC